MIVHQFIEEVGAVMPVRLVAVAMLALGVVAVPASASHVPDGSDLVGGSGSAYTRGEISAPNAAAVTSVTETTEGGSEYSLTQGTVSTTDGYTSTRTVSSSCTETITVWKPYITTRHNSKRAAEAKARFYRSSGCAKDHTYGFLYDDRKNCNITGCAYKNYAKWIEPDQLKPGWTVTAWAWWYCKTRGEHRWRTHAKWNDIASRGNEANRLLKCGG